MVTYRCPSCYAPRRFWRSHGVTVARVEYCSKECWGARLPYNAISEGNSARWSNTQKKFNTRQRCAIVACPYCASRDTSRTGTNSSPQFLYRRFVCGACDRDYTQRRARVDGAPWEFTKRKQLELVEDSAVAQTEIAMGA